MKCNDCYLRLHCDEQTEFICKYNDYCKYMQEPSNKDISAIKKVQYENDDDIILGTTPEYFARIAEDMNTTSEDIGARRLHTVVENLLEEISFNAGGDSTAMEVVIDKKYVIDKMGGETKTKDLKKYIL